MEKICEWKTGIEFLKNGERLGKTSSFIDELMHAGECLNSSKQTIEEKTEK